MNLKLLPSTAPTSSDTGVSDVGFAPVFEGHGDANYLCSACDTVLLKNMEQGSIKGLKFIKCPACKAWSKWRE